MEKATSSNAAQSTHGDEIRLIVSALLLLMLQTLGFVAMVSSFCFGDFEDFEVDGGEFPKIAILCDEKENYGDFRLASMNINVYVTAAQYE